MVDQANSATKPPSQPFYLAFFGIKDEGIMDPTVIGADLDKVMAKCDGDYEYVIYRITGYGVRRVAYYPNSADGGWTTMDEPVKMTLT